MKTLMPVALGATCLGLHLSKNCQVDGFVVAGEECRGLEGTVMLATRGVLTAVFSFDSSCAVDLFANTRTGHLSEGAYGGCCMTTAV